MAFDLESIKQKYSHNTDSKIFVGNADEIRSLISTVETQQTTIDELTKELKIANDMIKNLKKELKQKHRIEKVDKKAPYDDPND